MKFNIIAFIRRRVVRKRLRQFSIQPGLKILVYWKRLKIGKGPALILMADHQEVAKFDCFGKDKGHYHLIGNYQERIYFTEKTARAQIDRTINLLSENGESFLKALSSSKERNIKISDSPFRQALIEAKEYMNHILDTEPALQDI